jgi:hypothetical protein
MPNEKTTGGPAFPTLRHEHVPGMSLRDYFAAKAMQAIVSRGAVDVAQMAKHAYQYADAMLRATED